MQQAKDAASIYIPPASQQMVQQPQAIIRYRGDCFCSLSPRHPSGNTLMKRQKEEEEKGREEK